MSARRGSAVARWFVIRSLAAALAVPAALHASGPSCSVASPDSLTRAWPAPLDHRVSLRARDITLGAALDRLSAASSVAFAFSPDLLPLRRHVCVLVDQRPLGAALELLLRGSGMSPSVVAGRVVLVPQSGSAPSPADARGGEVDELERVVVSGNAEASARRPLTIGVQVVDGERLRQQSLGSLAELLDSAMPGAWVWSPSPASLLAQYGGIRGASSFGTSAPKIYLDGVEVANPLVVTQLDPDAIDRIEIIRGPQGSALYGSDAISGVVNVITRHEGAELPGTHLLVASTVGAGQSAYGGSLVASHDQHLALLLGDARRSGGLSAQYGQTGAVFPAASARQSIVAADGRMVGASSVWTASARLSDRIAGAGQNPLLAGLAIAATVDSGRGATTTTASVEPAPQRARQYTVGGNVVFGGDARVTHTLLLGVDGYRLANVAAASALYPVPMDSALGALDGAADRVTVRSSSVAHFGGGGAPLTTLTLGGDQSTLRLELPVARVTAPPVGLPWPIASESVERRWNHNTGLFTQVGTAWRDALFVSGGLRVERNDAFTGADRHPLLPMLGIAGVHEFGPASVKLRAAYGRGIRPPTVPARATYVEHGPASSLAAALDPESQAGTELGAEVYVGRVASLTLTRFDQLASGLIQNVLIAVDTQIRAGRPQQHMLYQLQNVGQIGNRGWELQGALTHGALTLSGALAFVDSRVRTVAAGYVGDLRAGDFMLGVPARTESLVATWVARDWTGTLSASRASHWVNYDRLALARDYAAAGGRAGKLGGPQLRDYWMNYDGDTHVRLSGSHPLGGALQLVLVGDNLLGGQLGEPDNVTIRPGRTLSAGLRAGF